jgi:hypothetical protein
MIHFPGIFEIFNSSSVSRNMEPKNSMLVTFCPCSSHARHIVAVFDFILKARVISRLGDAASGLGFNRIAGVC